jgi:hypothetical protein
MKAVAKRLRRLEQRWRPAVETHETRRLRTRLEAARLRCELPPISAERLNELRRMSIVEILNSGRCRASTLQVRPGEVSNVL